MNRAEILHGGTVHCFLKIPYFFNIVRLLDKSGIVLKIFS
jgi:hypothetical protein